MPVVLMPDSDDPFDPMWPPFKEQHWIRAKLQDFNEQLRRWASIYSPEKP